MPLFALLFALVATPVFAADESVCREILMFLPGTYVLSEATPMKGEGTAEDLAEPFPFDKLTVMGIDYKNQKALIQLSHEGQEYTIPYAYNHDGSNARRVGVYSSIRGRGVQFQLNTSVGFEQIFIMIDPPDLEDLGLKQIRVQVHRRRDAGRDLNGQIQTRRQSFSEAIFIPLVERRIF